MIKSSYMAAANAVLLVLAFGTTLADEPSTDVRTSTQKGTQGERSAKILERIATKIESNLNRVHTWSSEWTLEETLTHPGFGNKTDPFGIPYSISQQGTVHFDADFQSGKMYIEFLPSTEARFVEIASGKPLDSSRMQFGGMYRAVVTPEHLLSCDYGANMVDVEGFPSIPGLRANISRVSYRETTRIRERRPHLFDCRNFFKHFKGGFSYSTYADYLKTYIEKLSDPTLPKDIAVDDIRNLISVTLSKQGEHKLYTVRIRKLDRRTKKEMFVTEIVFDSSVSMNPVSDTSIVLPQRKPFRQTLLHYKKEGGLFIPDVVTVKSWDYNDPDSPVSRESRIFTLQKSTLNQPIPPEAFSTEQFQWEYGDRFCDRIKNTLSVFDGEKLVPAQDFEYNPFKDLRLEALKAAERGN
ncbi:hypothetical protein Mal52_45250 [Symmachiella dynata]|uniref:Uncharacterized protein n=1 Tax=Symmachiella dynata TaxID=2527995 RepID=A0A517ZU72_9PLAN|nr:hypothetical protein [Symmachiella dynata]QDU46028.1 hypothetical protein Mal52_45250 [Symmachiella dynata]